MKAVLIRRNNNEAWVNGLSLSYQDPETVVVTYGQLPAIPLVDCLTNTYPLNGSGVFAVANLPTCDVSVTYYFKVNVPVHNHIN